MAEVTLVAELQAKIADYEKNINSAVKTTVNGSKQIDAAAGKASKAIAGVNPASNSAAFALTNLGRVAQDVPFGFVGIQNNINPLLESFQRLKAESGSTGGALKALAGSLMGAGGLGLAVSLVTSALTIYTMWSQRSAKSTGENAKQTDEYTKALKESSSAAAEETTKVEVLYKASQDLTLPYADRLAVVKKLKSEFPEYFKNLSDETILAGKAQSAYEALNKAIIGKAAIQVASTQLNEAMKPLIDQAIKQATNEAQHPTTPFKDAIKNIQKTVDKGNGLIIPIDSFKFKGAQTDNVAPLENEAIKQANAADKIKQIQEGVVKRWQDTLQQLIKNFGASVVSGGGLDTKLPEGFDILEKLIADLKTKLETATVNGDQTLMGQLSLQITTAQEKLDKLKKSFDNSLLAGKGAPDLAAVSTTAVAPLNNTFSTPDIASPQGMQNAIKALTEYINLRGAAKQATKDMNVETEREKNNLQAITSIIGGGLMDAFSSAIQGTQSFVSAIGQFLTQFISKLVAAALAAAALSALLSFTGLGAFLGISSSASSFSNVFKGLSGLNFLADGGIATKPTLAMIGEGREPEVVAPLSKFSQMVQNNGGGSWKPEPMLIGADLFITWRNRAEKSNSRRS